MVCGQNGFWLAEWQCQRQLWHEEGPASSREALEGGGCSGGSGTMWGQLSEAEPHPWQHRHLALVLWGQRFPIRSLQWPEVMSEHPNLA